MLKSATHDDTALRRVVRLVALLNLGYFGVEFAVARVIGSVSLFADSIDFLEDASVNFLILAALGWSAVRRARVGMALAGILLVPGLATLWTAWEKFNIPVPPDPLPVVARLVRALSRSICPAPSCWPATGRMGAVLHGRLSCRPGMTRSPMSPLSGRGW